MRLKTGKTFALLLVTFMVQGGDPLWIAAEEKSSAPQTVPSKPVNPKDLKVNPEKYQSSTPSTASPKKTYVQQYKEFYNPKGFAERYKERYKPENYKQYYRDLHKQNAQTFNRSWNLDDNPANRIDEAEELTRRSGYSGVDWPFYRDHLQSRRWGGPGYGRSIALPDDYIELREQQDQLQQQAMEPKGIQPPQPAVAVPQVINPLQQQPALISPAYFMPLPKPATATISDSTGSKDDGIQTLEISDEDQPLQTPIDPMETTDPPSLDKRSQQSMPFDSPRPALQTNAPRSPSQLLIGRALKSLTVRNYVNARKTFQQMIETDPNSASAQFGYGLTSFYMGEYSEASNALKKSFQLSAVQSDQPLSYRNVPLNLDDYRFHRQKLLRYVNQNPNDVEASTLMFLLTKLEQNSQ